jgi:hypothetical protein
VRVAVRFLIVVASLPSGLAGQAMPPDSTQSEHVGHAALNLGFHNTGLSIGNSARWNGLRLNFLDHAVEQVNGVNLTIWSAEHNETMVMNGLALGITGPVGGEFRGATIGLLGAVAARGFAGLTVGGLGAVSDGSMAGINLAGLATVSSGSMRGLNVAGLGLVANKDLHGINFGGLATVGNGSVAGVTVGGLAIVAGGGLAGVSLGGLAVVSTGPLLGAAASVAAVVADPGVQGIALAGYHVEGAHWIRGLAASVVWNRVVDLSGIAIGGYNRVKGEQHGLTIGLYNYAKALHGVQLGLLNNARNNKGVWRILPLLNVHLD